MKMPTEEQAADAYREMTDSTPTWFGGRVTMFGRATEWSLETPESVLMTMV